jgi:hypothetical protein
MRQFKYELFALLLGIVGFSLAVFNKIAVSEISAQGLITFLSISFGFYVSALATLFNSKFAKTLHGQIDETLNERGIHKIARQFRFYFVIAIISIAILLYLSSVATVGEGGRMEFDWSQPQSLSLFDRWRFTITNFEEGCVYAIATINFYYTIVLANSIVTAFVEESARK